jgi:hypothetical protein
VLTLVADGVAVTGGAMGVARIFGAAVAMGAKAVTVVVMVVVIKPQEEPAISTNAKTKIEQMQNIFRFIEKPFLNLLLE